MTDDLPPGVSYVGPTGAIRDSNWLTNEDISHTEDTIVTIEDVMMRKGVKFQGGRTKERAYSLKFVGRKRELLVNATSKKLLNLLSGAANCGAWRGLTIALYVKPDVGLADGTVGPAVRLRAKRVTLPVTPTTSETPCS